jgi:hypothetical protein
LCKRDDDKKTSAMAGSVPVIAQTSQNSQPKARSGRGGTPEEHSRGKG